MVILFFFSNVGGLLGEGIAKDSYSKNQIVIENQDGSSISIGGLIGTGNDIYNSYAITNITANNVDKAEIGGLVGDGSKIGNSYSLGTISSQIRTHATIGGLVGRTHNNIKQSYASTQIKANVTGFGAVILAGGLYGSSLGVEYNSNNYSDGEIKIRLNDKFKTANIGGVAGTGTYDKNSYSNNTIQVEYDKNNLGKSIGGICNYNCTQTISVGGITGYDYYKKIDPLDGLFFNSSKVPNSLFITENVQENPISETGKTDSELRDPATFKDWDFENVWYMNKNADGTYSYPMLRAFAQTLTVNPTPTPPTAGVKAPDLSKTYDGKAITSVDDLKKLDGWKDNFDATGLATGDSVDGIFQAGTLTIDESKGDWKGAKDVKEGGYELYPTGTLKDEYQQKYIIEWNKGTLTINPAKLTITAMNNIKPEGDSNPDVSRIGVVVQGLVEGESISDVNLSYSDDKKWQGDISIIRVGEPVFKNGKASNYEITKKDGKLLTVQKEYDLKNITDKKPEDVAKIRDLLNSVEDEMLLAHAVYGSDSAKKGDNDRWYEIWEVKDKDSNIVVKELKPLDFQDNIPNDGKTYTKLYELIKDESFDYSDGVRYQITIKKDWAIDDTKIVTQAEYDELLKTTPKDNITINKTFRDGFYSSIEPNGLNMGAYRKVGTNKHFIVFRGTDTGRAVDPVGFDGIADSDGGNNSEQAIGKTPPQYAKAKELVQNLLNKDPNRDYTIIGHSLGGGLASYSSSQANKDIYTITFNPAALFIFNVKDKFKSYNNIHNLIFDNEINQNTNGGRIQAPVGAIIGAASVNLGYEYKTNFLPHKGWEGTVDASVPDHLMPHIIKTQQLSNIVANNNEILANCQTGCIKLQEHQWIPSAKSEEIKESVGTNIRANAEISNAIRQKFDNDTVVVDVDNIKLIDHKKPIAVVDQSPLGTKNRDTIVSVEKSSGLGGKIFALREWNIEHGDIIRTASKKAVIYFSDGSWVELAPHTTVRVDFSQKTDNTFIADCLTINKQGQGKILTKGNKKN